MCPQFRNMRKFTYRVGLVGWSGPVSCDRFSQQCCHTPQWVMQVRVAMDALDAAPHPAPHTLPTPGPAPQTVGLLPTHCPPALDSPALAAAYAQSGFAYMDVSAGLLAE